MSEEKSVPVSEYDVRVSKVQQMRQEGIEPWPTSKSVDTTCASVVSSFKEGEEQEYAVAGRIVSLRLHGKTLFAHIQDRSGKLQIYARQDDLGTEKFETLCRFIDRGDFLWCLGSLFRTKTGEVTLKVKDCVLLSKSLHPLAEKFHGLVDIETIYRQRYLDLIAHESSRERFIKRSKIIKTIRSFLDEHDFLEVETPMLHPIAGGALARPFVTHHNALNNDFYLRIAPELYLKRLVVGGFERVYEINRSFRNEGISTRHNPEFTMLEFYMAYEDYQYAMDFVQQLVQRVVTAVNGVLEVEYGQLRIDFGTCKRMSLFQAVYTYTEYTESDLVAERIDAVLAKHQIHVADKHATHAQKIYALFEKLVEPQLIQPTFITHFPIEVSPLAQRDPEHPELAARFELFIAGLEISNGFNELNDPFDQAARFERQARAHSGGDIEAHRYDADYIQALEYGLPPTVGVGIGIDRLTMLLTNAMSIKDVILFPTLKRHE